MEEAETAGTMARDMEEIELGSEESLGRPLIEEEIGGESLDFEGEAVAMEGVRPGHKRQGIWMNSAGAVVLVEDFGPIDDVIEVPVGEQQEVNFFVGEVGGSAVRGVDEDISLGQFEKKAVRFEDAARKRFELKHKYLVEVVHNLELV